jgi:GNAT superfamily N-acetyltransferase
VGASSEASSKCRVARRRGNPRSSGARGGAIRLSRAGIRRASAGDAAQIAPLLAELGYPATPEEVARRLGALEGPENVILVTIGDDGGILGVIGLHSFPTLHAAAPVCYITALVVAAAARGRGIGRRMLEAADAWARERGCSRIVVTSAERRVDAHAFYERSGFERTGRRFVRTLG